MEVEAHFLAKEDGVIAGITLAEMVFHEVDPSLKVLRLGVFFSWIMCGVCPFSFSYYLFIYLFYFFVCAFQ